VQYLCHLALAVGFALHCGHVHDRIKVTQRHELLRQHTGCKRECLAAQAQFCCVVHGL
jgi:hypothetical protein